MNYKKLELDEEVRVRFSDRTGIVTSIAEDYIGSYPVEVTFSNGDVEMFSAEGFGDYSSKYPHLHSINRQTEVDKCFEEYDISGDLLDKAFSISHTGSLNLKRNDISDLSGFAIVSGVIPDEEDKEIEELNLYSIEIFSNTNKTDLMGIHIFDTIEGYNKTIDILSKDIFFSFIFETIAESNDLFSELIDLANLSGVTMSDEERFDFLNIISNATITTFLKQKELDLKKGEITYEDIVKYSKLGMAETMEHSKNNPSM